MNRLALLAALLLALPCWADDRPGMDDFYARTRGRHAGFDRCVVGLCDGTHLLQLLVGAQMANPSTDALRPALAEGLRLGLDGGIRGGYAVARARAWADLLWVNETGQRLTEYVGQVTGFLTTAGPGGLGLHVQGDAQIAARTELEPQDFAEFQAAPFTVLDVEGEVAAVGPKIDKEAFLALPVGYAYRARWNDTDGGALTEQRRTVSAAAALRAFQKKNRFHYQLEALRLTRVDWSIPAGDASAWKAQLGYQRLSPDIPGVQLWLLFGWAWVDGAREDHGFITRIGVDVDFMDLDGGVNLPHVSSAQYQRDFTLDRVSRRFRHLDQLRLYHGTTMWDPIRVGLAYELAAVESVGALHVLEPEVAWRPFDNLGVEIGVRVRFRVRSDDDAAAAIPDSERFQFNLDWLL